MKRAEDKIKNSHIYRSVQDKCVFRQDRVGCARIFYAWLPYQSFQNKQNLRYCKNSVESSRRIFGIKFSVIE